MHVLHDSTAPRQLHEPWSMAVVHCDETPDDFARRVANLARESGNGVRRAPAAVWRLLSTPLTHPGARDHEDAALFCRTMVCAADVDESFDLVRWLGRSRRVEVVRRRFAGTDTPDVETDYVDFAESHSGDERPARPVRRVHRVIAMARNGIRIGLTRAFMADYGCIALLRGNDPRRDANLLEMLVAACARLPQRPALVGVGGDVLQHAELRQTAQRRGMTYTNVDVEDRRDPAQVWAALEPVVQRFAPPLKTRRSR